MKKKLENINVDFILLRHCTKKNDINVNSVNLDFYCYIFFSVRYIIKIFFHNAFNYSESMLTHSEYLHHAT